MAIKLIFLLCQPQGIISGSLPLLFFFPVYLYSLLQCIVPVSYFLSSTFCHCHRYHFLFHSIVFLFLAKSLSLVHKHSSSMVWLNQWQILYSYIWWPSWKLSWSLITYVIILVPAISLKVLIIEFLFFVVSSHSWQLFAFLDLTRENYF